MDSTAGRALLCVLTTRRWQEAAPLASDVLLVWSMGITLSLALPTPPPRTPPSPSVHLESLGCFFLLIFFFNDVTELYCAFRPAGQPPITMWITRRRFSGSGWEMSRGSITMWSGGRWMPPSKWQCGNSSSPGPGFPAACASDLEVHADFPYYPFCIWVANSAFSSINRVFSTCSSSLLLGCQPRFSTAYKLRWWDIS